jgi:hypothetical protein
MRPFTLNAARVFAILGWAGAWAVPHVAAVAADSGASGLSGGLDSPPVVSTSASARSAGPEVATAKQAPALGDDLKPSARPANLLWRIPLDSLSARRDRPIFSPSRRPPVVAQAAPVKSESPPPTASIRRSESTASHPARCDSKRYGRHCHFHGRHHQGNHPHEDRREPRRMDVAIGCKAPSDFGDGAPGRGFGDPGTLSRRPAERFTSSSGRRRPVTMQV